MKSAGDPKSGAGPRSRSRWKRQRRRITRHTFEGSGRRERILSHSGRTSSLPNSPCRNLRNAASHASAAAVSGSTSKRGSTPASAGKERRTRAQNEWNVVTEMRPTPSTISSTRRRNAAKSG